MGCGPKNLSLDDYFSYGETLSNGHMLSAIALQFTSTGNSRFYICNTDGCNGESPTKYYKTIIEGFSLLIVGSFGVVGNILTVIVLIRPSMRSTVNLIFTGESNLTTLVRGFTFFFFDTLNVSRPNTRIEFEWKFWQQIQAEKFLA